MEKIIIVGTLAGTGVAVVLADAAGRAVGVVLGPTMELVVKAAVAALPTFVGVVTWVRIHKVEFTGGVDPQGPRDHHHRGRFWAGDR